MKWPSVILLPMACATHAESWVEAGLDHQQFSSGASSAETSYVAASSKQATRTIYGELDHFERYDHIDTQGTLGIYQKVTGTGTLHLETALAPGAQIKPRTSLYGGWYQKLPQGWTVEPGMQYTHYVSDLDPQSRVNLTVDRYSLATEKYISNWRLVYVIADVRLAGNSALNQRLQADRFYGDHNRIGVGYAWGDDQERDTSQVTTTPVKTVYVTGQHAFSPRWNLIWQVQQIDQGNLYRQRGARIGVRYLF